MRLIAFIIKMPLLHPSKLSLGKVIVILATILIILQLFHMCLLTRLESRDSRETAKLSVRKDEFIQVVDRMIKRILSSYVLDRGGSYQIIANLLTATSSNSHTDRSMDVSVVTQTSSNNLGHLIELSKTWRGPISVSVFTHDSDSLNAMYMIAYLHLCYPTVAEWTTFHLAYPLTAPPKGLQNIKVVNFSCDKDTMPFSDDTRGNYAIENIQYPQNLLRNLAIQSSNTGFIFVIDIDMLPSKHLRSNFTNFIARHYDKTKSDHPPAFVVPAFEAKSSAIIPYNKQELLQNWNLGNIRPFYSDVCWKCQKHTNYEQWKIEPIVNGLEESFSIDWKDPWEPFYISAKTLPLYDERFQQYGFNRISQVCELHVAGYKFAVLNNAFLVHRGFKTAQDFHPSKSKELDKNRLLFRQFKEELKTKYSGSSRRCY